MWGDTMRTLAIITVATLLSIGLGVPIGIAMARSDRVQTLVTPILDIMQTMPAFVYLIPVVMLLGIGKGNNIGKTIHEPLEVCNHGGDLRLLEHDFTHPTSIRV